MLFSSIDKELGICGREEDVVVHSDICIKLLWKENGCTQSPEIYSTNLDRWKGAMATKQIKDEMQAYWRNAGHHSLLSSWKMNLSYREFCFGPLTFSNTNIALYKTINASVYPANDLYHPSHIVDGVEYQDPRLGGCGLLEGSRPWIYIDLLNAHVIKKAVLIPPSCCSK